MSTPTGKMNAWRLRAGSTEVLMKKSIPIPRLAPDQVLVKVQAMGVCHSDCAIRDTPQRPVEWEEEFTLGHEAAGEIVQLGSEVDQSEIKLGDKVVMYPLPGCKEKGCIPCNAGNSRLCRTKTGGTYGIGRDGLFQEFVAIRADLAVRIPDGIPITTAAIASDALLTAFHAVKYVAGAGPDQTIAILGLGGLGLNGLQTAIHLGVKRLIVCDKKQAAVDLAVKLGVSPEDAICTDGPEAKKLHEVVAERKIVVDTAIDFAGHEETAASAQLSVRPLGLVVQVGLLSRQVPMFPALMVTNELTIKGTFCGTVDGLRECLDLLAQGVIQPKIETDSIMNLPQVLRDMDEGKYQGRKVLLPSWG